KYCFRTKKRVRVKIAMSDLNELLRLEDISNNFGAVCALRNISFSIFKGETVALLGDNGAGKSTLNKIISGSLQPDTGRFIFNGREVPTFSPFHSRNLGIETVYQNLSLCILLTGKILTLVFS
ncbi:MAG: ATP-binding cassette domain-containing protein, partial [Chitinivibrionales bacterium]|nr:ATP-binding cassette domain-containing protein [Chitinivibrionales bacterium]